MTAWANTHKRRHTHKLLMRRRQNIHFPFVCENTHETQAPVRDYNFKRVIFIYVCLIWHVGSRYTVEKERRCLKKAKGKKCVFGSKLNRLSKASKYEMG